MPAHPEHITASHALHRVSSFIQILHIARQCGGIAADIDYPLWLHPDDRVEADAVTAFARRIDNNHICVCVLTIVRLRIFFIIIRQNFLGFSDINSAFLIPLILALFFASSIACGTISTPYTCFAF